MFNQAGGNFAYVAWLYRVLETDLVKTCVEREMTRNVVLYQDGAALGHNLALDYSRNDRIPRKVPSCKELIFLDGVFATAFSNPLPSLYPGDLLVGIACGAALRLAVYLKGKNAKKFRHNEEYGSARWGKHADIEPFEDPVFANNVILSQSERITMSSRPKIPKYARNKNVLVVGGSGSGKTRFFIKPNLLQMHSSYVVTDPKGGLVNEVGNALYKNGYRMKIFNTINFSKSMHYNPFAYIHSEKDILKLVTTLIANTKGEGKAGDDFWVSATRSQTVKSLRTSNGFPLFGELVV